MTFREMYEEDFFQKYGPDSEKSDNEFLYEDKDKKGFAAEGEDKSWIKYVGPNEFFTEEFPLPYDLMIPFCC